MRELLRRLHFYLNRHQFERDMDEEMHHHLALKAEQNGSKDAAQRQFGNITLLKEESRAMWSWRLFDQLAQDTRYAVRAMGASPLFTTMAVLSLALGIGANTAIYSFLDAILLRSLPVAHPEELVVVQWRAKERPKVIHGHNGTRDGDKTGVFSPNYPFAAYESLRSDSSVLSTLFAYATAYRINLVAQNQAEVGNGQFVSGSFYRSLGVSPAAGRLIDENDDRAGAERVAVLSYRYWQSRYGSDPSAVGQSIRINDVPFTIVGVSAPEFFGVNPGQEHQVYHADTCGSITGSTTGRRRKAAVFRSELLLGGDDGPFAPGCEPDTGGNGTGRKISTVCREHRIDSLREKESAGVVANGRSGRLRLAAPPVFSAALCTDDDGLPDTRDFLCEYCESATGSSNGAQEGNRGAAQSWRRPHAFDAAVADREYSAGCDGRRSGPSGCQWGIRSITCYSQTGRTSLSTRN